MALLLLMYAHSSFHVPRKVSGYYMPIFKIIKYSFVVHLDLDVTCTAVEQPGVNIKNVRDLAISLGARDFVSSKYFP